MSVPIVNLGNGHVSNLGALGQSGANVPGCPYLDANGKVHYDVNIKLQSMVDGTSGTSVADSSGVCLGYIVDIWSQIVAPFVQDKTPVPFTAQGSTGVVSINGTPSVTGLA